MLLQKLTKARLVIFGLLIVLGALTIIYALSFLGSLFLSMGMGAESTRNVLYYIGGVLALVLLVPVMFTATLLTVPLRFISVFSDNFISNALIVLIIILTLFYWYLLSGLILRIYAKIKSKKIKA